MSVARSIAKKLRPALVNAVKDLPGHLCVPLSGGVDSHSLLFAALAAKKSVVATSFMLDGVLSTDFSVARDTARKFNVEFVPIFLPTSVTQLEYDVTRLIHDYGCRKKTDIECLWPFLYVAHALKGIDYFVSGYHTDVYFGLSRKASVAGCAKSVTTFDKFREDKMSDFPNQQVKVLRQLLGNVAFPYSGSTFKSLFMGVSWADLNKPQKAPIRHAFTKEFKRTKVQRHSNLQLGDSRISEHFKKLLESDTANPERKYSSVVGVYNDIARKA